jgi:hypothetical protein
VLLAAAALAEDEVTLYELLPPDTHQFAIVYDVSQAREGLEFFFNPIRAGSVASPWRRRWPTPSSPRAGRASREIPFLRQVACALTRPGIDQFDAKAVEVARVVRGGCRSPCRRNTGDLYVSDFDAAAQATAMRSESRRQLGRVFVEPHDAAFEVVLDHGVERVFEYASPSSGRENLQPESNLEDGDRRRPRSIRVAASRARPGRQNRPRAA